MSESTTIKRHQASLEAMTPDTPPIPDTFPRPEPSATPENPSHSENSPQPENPLGPSPPNRHPPRISSHHANDYPEGSACQHRISLADGLEDFSHLLIYDAIPDGGFQERSNGVSLARRQREIKPETPSMPETPSRPETPPILETPPTQPEPRTPPSTGAPPKTPASLLEIVYPSNEALLYEVQLGDLDACIDKLRVEMEKRGGGRALSKEFEAAKEKLKFLERQVLVLELLKVTQDSTPKLENLVSAKTLEKIATVSTNDFGTVEAARSEIKGAARLAKPTREDSSRRQSIRSLGEKLAASIKERSGLQATNLPKP